MEVTKEMGSETEGEPGGHWISFPFRFSREGDGKFWVVSKEGSGVSIQEGRGRTGRRQFVSEFASFDRVASTGNIFFFSLYKI